MTLRPYQVRAIDELRAAVASGSKRVLLEAPTSAGKTQIFCALLASAVAKGRRGLVICHQAELIDQAVKRLSEAGIKSGVVMGSDSRRDDSAPVLVCSIATLARRKSFRPHADVIVADEAHLALSDSWREVFDSYPNATILGFTASPYRLDGRPFGDLFQRVVKVASVRELIDLEYLSDFVAYAMDCPQLHEVPLALGDYRKKELSLAMNTSILVGNCVEEYRKNHAGKPALCFCVSLEHSRNMAEQFRAAGFRALHVGGDTPPDERAQAFSDIQNGRLDVLCNVAIATTGVDLPRVEVALIARPTQSLALWIQITGRILRKHPDKPRAVIVDFGGNCLRHGLPDEHRESSLEGAPKRQPQVMVCTACNVVVKRFPTDGKCPACGDQQNIPADIREAVNRRKGKETVDGDKLDTAAIRKVREQFAATGKIISREDADRIANASREQKAAEYLRLLEVAKRRSYSRGWVGHQYRATFQVWPRFKDEELQGVVPALYPFLNRNTLRPIERETCSPKRVTLAAHSSQSTPQRPDSCSSETLSGVTTKFLLASIACSGELTRSKLEALPDSQLKASLLVTQTLPDSYVADVRSISNSSLPPEDHDLSS